MQKSLGHVKDNETFEKRSFLPAQLNLSFYLTGVQVQGRRKFLTEGIH
jgi:hypothetical protein